ncbi:serine hydroxymethyltransferase [Streptomyces sp. NEAU-sy36]|uniref:serine hydroxymethyltransferase n=1 Tax=unclassified Streptomyces TaxID=2593676 RepID=UPI0015D5CB55|nr:MULTISPECIES: serine hydroxymethyltransferase [unclassified Streptomyces]QLJ03531.1 serine hydroxymethyltransferase [Streptomyces sp. NEAU-sy36]
MRDLELARLLHREDRHYLESIDLIAASNAPIAAVRDNHTWGVAQFRSAEGHVGRKPYAGTSVFDEVERITAHRARAVFGGEHANVQPASGSLANLAAYRALLRPGDTLLSMAVTSGGHLSHGHPKHIVSELYRVVPYSVDPETGLLPYDDIREIAERERPRVIVAGYSAYPRAVDFALFGEVARDVGATLVADISHIAGLVAAGLHANPCAQPETVVTTSVEKTLRGTRGGIVLCPESLRTRIDSAIFPGLQSSVGMAGLVSLAATLQDAATPAFRVYQERVVANARLLAGLLLDGGLDLVTGGTDTHLLVVDLTRTALTGREAEGRLQDLGILSNRNMLPADPRPPFVASGLRLGTPTITSRGFDEDDVRELADIVLVALRARDWDAPQITLLRKRADALRTRPRPDDALGDLAASTAAAGDEL